jgi:hypothetical protein
MPIQEIHPMRARSLLTALIVAGLALMIALPSPADEPPGKEKIDKLIQQMGSGSFSEREKATKELEAIGLPALKGLRQAARSDDTEVRKRAGDLLLKIERRAESQRVLAPRRVHLVYKDTPLYQAVADFQKKSGYAIHLHDPEGKLKDRTITLDTEATTFWHAVALFCAKAELSEASVEDLMPARNQPGGARSPAPWWPTTGQELILKAGKANKVPTDDRCAIRIQALARADLPGNYYEGEFTLPLEVSLEPKLSWNTSQSWNTFQSIHIDKAVDDQGQQLTQVIPRIEGATGFDDSSKPPRIRKVDPQGAQQMSMRPFPRSKLGGVGLTQLVTFELNKGAREAKSLRELKGVLTMQLRSEVRPVIVADQLNKAAGKTFKAAGGGSIKIANVASDEKQTTIKLELEQGDIMPLLRDLTPGEGIALGGAGQLTNRMNGLCIQDDKGKSLPIDGSRSQGIMSMAKRGKDGLRKITTYTLVCPHGKDRGKPARVVYLGRNLVTVEVPFALKDVPLP